jgi:transcriptional regulator with XRE-family HTH domain
MALDVARRLGARLHDLRTSAGLTQEGLAVRAGITWHFVSAIERGTKTPTLDTLTGIASALDLTLSELFLDVDRPLPKELARLSTALAARDAATQRAILRVVGELLALSATPPATSLRAADRPRKPRR